MRLRILRNESKGMLGGISFEYTIKIDVSPQESALIQKYRGEREIIYSTERALLGQKWEINFTLGDFIKGKTIKSRNIVEMIALEEATTSACKSIKVVLNALAKIGQEEVIEF